MTVGAGDPARLAAFDESAAATFALLCRLTAGDHSMALELLVDTYAALDLTEPGTQPNKVFEAARRTYLRRRSANGLPTGNEPVASLTPLQRVTVEMHSIGGQQITAIASALDESPAIVDAAISDGTLQLRSRSSTSPAEAFRLNEVWFDDRLRAAARTALENRPAVSRPAARADRRRWRFIAVGVGLVAILVATVVWLDRSGDRSPADVSGALRAKPLLTNASRSKKDPTETVGTVNPSKKDPTESVGETADTTTDSSADTTVDANVDTSSTNLASVGFIADPIPNGYVGSGVSDSTFGATADTSTRQLWSSDDATHTRGRWFAVAATNAPNPGSLSTDPAAERVVVAGYDALLSDAGGELSLTVQLPHDALLHFRTFGITLRELTTLVGSVTFGIDGTLAFGPAADPVLHGLSPRIAGRSAAVELDLLGFASVEASGYYAAATGDAFVQISSGPQTVNDILAARLLLDTPVPSTVPADSTVTIGRRLVVLGQVDDRDTLIRSAIWHEGARTVIVSGNVSEADLIAFVASLRPASPQQWLTLQNAPGPAKPTTFEGSPHQVGIGSEITSAGDTWSVTLQDAGRNQLLLVTEFRHSDVSGSGYQHSSLYQLAVSDDPEHPLVRADFLDATVVAATFASPPTGAVALRVTVVDGQPVDVPLVHVGDESLVGAAFAFSERAAFTAQLIDRNGSVIRDLDR